MVYAAGLLSPHAAVAEQCAVGLVETVAAIPRAIVEIEAKRVGDGAWDATPAPPVTTPPTDEHLVEFLDFSEAQRLADMKRGDAMRALQSAKPSMTTFQVEDYDTCRAEIDALLFQHWQEVAIDHQRVAAG